MKNLSIKKQLISSFAIIAFLIVFLSTYSILRVSNSSDGFKSYREMAKDTVLISFVQSNMLMVRMNVKDYLNTHSKKDIEDFTQYYNETIKYLEKAKIEIKDEKRALLVKELEIKLKEYKQHFTHVVKFMKKRDIVVNKNLNINGKKIEQLLSSVMMTAKQDKDLEASLNTALGVRSLLLARLYVTKFLMTNHKEDKNRVLKEFSDLKKELSVIQKSIQNKTRTNKLKEAIVLIEKYQKGIHDITSAIEQRNKSIKILDEIGPHIASITEKVKSSVKQQQDKIGPQVEEDNQNLQIMIQVISFIVFVLIITISTLIPKEISKQLEEFQNYLLDFFKYLNREKSDIQMIKNNFKTEIGLMTKVVNENILITKKSIDEDRKLIDETVKVLNEFEQGDLFQRVSCEVNNPVLNELKTVLNKMGDNLENNIDSILNVLEEFANYSYLKKVNTNGIKQHLEKLALGVNSLGESITLMLIENKTTGEELNKSSSLLLENVDILNKSSNESAASLEETAAALEQITGNISLTGQKVQKMNQLTTDLNSSVQTGEKLANKTSLAMEDINTQVSSISDAISVIDQIAFQTNILSLNAAVEAATAGEAGKGFAVVAQEVRNLASRSAQAAKEIKELVETATLKANEGKEIASSMIVGYEGLKENINETIIVISDVSNASKEQEQGIIQINDTISLLDQQTQQNAHIASKTQDIALNTSNIATTIVEKTNEKEFRGKNEKEED